MKLHKFCSMFPPVEGEEFQEIVTDVKLKGLKNKIITFNGEILDGQNRFNACQAADVKPRFQAFKGTEQEAFDFVISQNMQRRHLSAGQRAMIIVNAEKYKNSTMTISGGSKKMKVSRATIHAAKRIKKQSPKLAKQVAAGTLTINAAAKKIEGTLPPRERRPMSLADQYSNTPAQSIYAKREEPKETRVPGQVAFDAYYDKLGSKPLETWEDIPAKERAAWIAAAAAVKG